MSEAQFSIFYIVAVFAINILSNDPNHLQLKHHRMLRWFLFNATYVHVPMVLRETFSNASSRPVLPAAFVSLLISQLPFTVPNDNLSPSVPPPCPPPPPPPPPPAWSPKANAPGANYSF